jgi:hypothetical protein
MLNELILLVTHSVADCVRDGYLCINEVITMMVVASDSWILLLTVCSSNARLIHFYRDVIEHVRPEMARE